MKKKFITILIAFLFFVGVFYYKKINNGNNKLSQIDIAEKFINNTNSYIAEIDVISTSNKNELKYSLKQEESQNYSLEEVTKGNVIEGLKLEIKDNILRVTNTKLNLEKIYENYNDVCNNSLFLSTFIKEYKDLDNKTTIKDTEDEIILKIELPENRYIRYKELFLNKKNGKPIKMVISNSYQKQTTSIIYNNIEMK